MDELEELLHSNHLDRVDVLPLIEKHTEGVDANTRNRIRLRVLEHLDELERSGLIITNKDYHFQLARQLPTAFDPSAFMEDPIYVRGTMKFEKEYKEKHTAPVQPITNSGTMIYAPDNKGQVTQVLDSPLSEIPMTQGVTTTPSINPSATSISRRYTTAVFKYFIWPVAGLIAAALILHFVFNIG